MPLHRYSVLQSTRAAVQPPARLAAEQPSPPPLPQHAHCVTEMAAKPAAPIKILVCGDVCGSFAALMAKVAKVNGSHGPFALLLCTGQFFSTAQHDNLELQPYLSGIKAIPVPTYFIAADEDHSALIDHLPDGGELCPGLHYLGRAGVKKLAGLTVAYLSGVWDAERYFDVNEEQRSATYERHYIEDDVVRLAKEAAGEGHRQPHCNGAERLPSRLVSSFPPASIGSPVVAKLATQMQLRYHFAAHHDVYFELPPYKNHSYFTRFFALGRHGGKSKEKSLYACNVSPSFTVDPTNLPAELTACPYTVTGKRDKPDAPDSPHSKRAKTPGFVRAGAMDAAMADPPRPDEQLMSTRWDFTKPARRPPPPHYICNICHLSGHWIQDCELRANKPAPSSADSDIPPASYICNKCRQPGHYIRACPLIAEEEKARHEGPPPGDYRCRKCGGSHWIQRCPVIAEEERAKAKQRSQGSDGVAGAGCWFCLATEGVRVHLIVSVGDECYLALAKGPLVPHHLLILPIVHVQAATQMTEAQQREADKYKESLTRFYASEGLRPIFYERNIPTRAGQHLHIQCVPVTPAQFDDALPTIQREAAALPVTLDLLPPDTSLQTAFPEDTPYLLFEVGEARLGHRVVKGKIPGLFDFQRSALAALIGQPDRADWRKCEMSEEEETAVVDSIKALFKPFDFTEAQAESE